MRFLFFTLLVLGVVSCTPKKDSAKSTESQVAGSENLTLARAKLVYNSNCAVCHGADLQLLKEGGVGPNIFGSSEAVLKSKMLLGSYPEGHTPKRSSKVMPLFPQLEKEIPGLALFLNSKN